MEKITIIECKRCGINFDSHSGKKRELCETCIKRSIKENGYKSSIKRMIRNREFINQYKKDKKCTLCGYNKYPSLLAFHHKNRKGKDTDINTLKKSLKNLKIIEKEIKKCILACPNCHSEIHLKEGYYPNKKYAQ
jgi:ferredoxin